MTGRLLGVLALCGAIAAWRATAFLPALNAEQPLAATPAVVGAGGPRLARKVVLVIVDGLRLDASREIPTLERLRARGVDAQAKAPFPTLSMPNYVTIATGVGPLYSGFRTNDATRSVEIDSVFARARAAKLRVGYVSFRPTAMSALFGSHFDHATDSPDLARDLVVVVNMEVDRAGHAHGGDDEEYRDVVHAQDRWLAQVLETMDLEHDAIIVTADHGHADRGGHGGDSAAMANVPVVMAGAGVRRGARLGEIELADLAPTIGALLGVPAAGHGTGSTLVDALAIEPGAVAALVGADAKRLAVIGAAEQRIDVAREERHRGALLLGLPLAMLALGGGAALLLAAHRRRRLVIDRVAIAVGVTFSIVFFVLAGLGERWLSEPGVPGELLSLWLEYARYGVGAGVALGASVAIALRGRTRDVMVGALAFGLVIVVGVAVVVWAMVGGTLATMLPSPLLVIVTPVAYMAVAWYAVAAVGVIAASALVARLRRRYPRAA